MAPKIMSRIRKNNAALGAAVVLILFGVGTLAISLGISMYQQATANHADVSSLLGNNPPARPARLISGTPIHITIPSVGISNNVIPGYYYPATRSWTLSLNNVQYGVMSAKANNIGGATYIYGHDRLGLFYPLSKIAPGANATVATANGHTFIYTYRSNVVTSPSDTSIFKYKGAPVLVLQTCSGIWYQSRQLFIFNLTKWT